MANVRPAWLDLTEPQDLWMNKQTNTFRKKTCTFKSTPKLKAGGILAASGDTETYSISVAINLLDARFILQGWQSLPRIFLFFFELDCVCFMQLDPEEQIKIFYVTEIGRSRSLCGFKCLIRSKIIEPSSLRAMIFFFFFWIFFFFLKMSFFGGKC